MVGNEGEDGEEGEVQEAMSIPPLAKKVWRESLNNPNYRF